MKWSIVLVLLVAADGLSQQALSLKEAIILAKTNNKALQRSSAAVLSEEAGAAEASSRLYPGLSFVAGYTRIEEGAFRLSTTNQPQPLSVGSVVTDNYLFRIGLRQPLFTGFRLSGLSDAAELRYTASLQEHAMAEHNTVFSVTAAYWSLYQLRRTADLAGENVARLEAYRADTQKLMENGLATRNDLLRVEVRLSNARIAALQAGNDAQLAGIRLNTLIGNKAMEEVVLTTTPGDIVVQAEKDSLHQVESIEALVDIARERRPDLIAAGYRSDAAGQMVSATSGRWWPQIDLTANYQYNNPNSRYQPITPEFLGSWDVGVSLVVDLWNWGETRSQVEQAEAARRQAEIYRMQVMDEVVLEVSEAALNLKRSREKMAVAQLAAEQADENLRATSDKYRTGLATSTELLDAEVDLYTAQVQFSGAEVEYALACAGLVRSVGGAAEESPR
jgi:outer membrane protein